MLAVIITWLMCYAALSVIVQFYEDYTKYQHTPTDPVFNSMAIYSVAGINYCHAFLLTLIIVY